MTLPTVSFSDPSLDYFVRGDPRVARLRQPLTVRFGDEWRRTAPSTSGGSDCDLDGHPAMYDAVSGRLYHNAGTGEFQWGEL